ncbi:hypothetical protein ACHAAC_17170 [Aeromicrobium sp. CF4.19]|uniref:hypothetical protein n=1 Tax=Aeromicrobium sp. CF4.19 TaxID=3373082 RepID=UPI003EE4E3A7
MAKLKGGTRRRAKQEEAEQEPTPIPRPLTTQLQRRSRFGRLTRSYRLSERALETSTRQGEALNVALVSTNRPKAGPPMGIDVETGTPVTSSPHHLYAQGLITSPNVVILGDIGSAKSSLSKTHYCLRHVAMGMQVATFDRKNQAGIGEYAGAAAAAGGTVIRFSRRNGSAINLLDPRISMTSSEDEDSGRVGQDRLLEMVAQFAHGELSSQEHYALRAAHASAVRTARDRGRTATIRDVIEALYAPVASAVPHEVLRERGLVDEAELTRWGMYLAMDLARFVDGDLSGLIDGETSDDLDWESPMLVFDTSELDEGSPALALVMALVVTFLSSVWAASDRRKVIVVEEGYHTANLVAGGTVNVASILRSLVKRGRGIGLSFVTIFHHLSDVPEDSDAMSLIREAEVMHIYRQSREADQQACIEFLGLPPELPGLLSQLERGVHVYKAGKDAPRVVRHIRTPFEESVSDTDEAMRGGTR